jgi:chromosome condensin MukBEF ATPase and DNA-binding subunit MukB
MGKISLVYVLFGISPRFWNGLRTYTEVPLHGIPEGATHEETLQALEDRFGDQHFAAAYRRQLKTKTQRIAESFQEFATAIERLGYRT